MHNEFDQGKFHGEVMAKLESIHTSVVALGFNVEQQEKRIRMLEQWRWWLLGGIGAGVGLPQIAKAMGYL